MKPNISVATAAFTYNGFGGDCAKCGRHIATQQGVACNFRMYCRTCIGQAIEALVGKLG